MKRLEDKEKLFLEWFHTHREYMQINLSIVGDLRAAFFGGLETAKQSAQISNPCEKHNMEFCVECFPVVSISFVK